MSQILLGKGNIEFLGEGNLIDPAKLDTCTPYLFMLTAGVHLLLIKHEDGAISFYHLDDERTAAVDAAIADTAGEETE